MPICQTDKVELSKKADKELISDFEFFKDFYKLLRN